MTTTVFATSQPDTFVEQADFVTVEVDASFSLFGTVYTPIVTGASPSDPVDQMEAIAVANAVAIGVPVGQRTFSEFAVYQNLAVDYAGSLAAVFIDLEKGSQVGGF